MLLLCRFFRFSNHIHYLSSFQKWIYSRAKVLSSCKLFPDLSHFHGVFFVLELQQPLFHFDDTLWNDLAIAIKQDYRRRGFLWLCFCLVIFFLTSKNNVKQLMITRTTTCGIQLALNLKYNEISKDCIDENVIRYWTQLKLVLYKVGRLHNH